MDLKIHGKKDQLNLRTIAEPLGLPMHPSKKGPTFYCTEIQASRKYVKL